MASTELVCPKCGRADFSSPSGLTLHQKKCTGSQQPEAPPPEDGNGNGSHALSKPPSDPDDQVVLTSTERQQFYRLITRRQETILRALGDELQGGSKEDVVLDRVRAEKGQLYAPDQISSLISSVDEQIAAEKEKHIGKERTRLKVQRAEILEKFEEKAKEMKDRHREEYRALISEKKNNIEKIRDELTKLEDEIANKYAAPLMQKKLEYQAQLADAKQKEMEIKAEARYRSICIRQSRGRLEHTIRDASGRALEKLSLEAKTRGDAKRLLDSIPTVADAIKLTTSKEGIEELFRRLDPNMPMPAQLPPPAPEGKIIDAEVVSSGVKPAVAKVVDDEETEDDDDNFEALNLERERRTYNVS